MAKNWFLAGGFHFLVIILGPNLLSLHGGEHFCILRPLFPIFGVGHSHLTRNHKQRAGIRLVVAKHVLLDDLLYGATFMFLFPDLLKLSKQRPPPRVSSLEDDSLMRDMVALQVWFAFWPLSKSVESKATIICTFAFMHNPWSSCSCFLKLSLARELLRMWRSRNPWRKASFVERGQGIQWLKALVRNSRVGIRPGWHGMDNGQKPEMGKKGQTKWNTASSWTGAKMVKK